MKNFFPKVTAVTLAVSLVVFLISSCAVEDLTKDLTIYTGSGFLINPISIQVADAAHLEAVPTDLIVSIEGRDKAKIFTLMGQSKIEAVSGIIALAVKAHEVPTVANPLEFTLVLSAPNYVTIRKNFVLTQDAELSTDKVTMVNLMDAPKGVSIQNTSFSSTTSGTAQNFAFASPLSNGKSEQVKVNMATGTKTLGANGSVLSGSVQAQLVHYDVRSEVSLRGFTENFNDLNVKVEGSTGKTIMNPAGFYSLSMTAGNQEISKFSQPLDVTMDIDENFFSVVHNRKIKEGDVLDVISRTENETVWTAETKATVVNVGGKLKASFKQAHLSVWVIGDLTQKQDICVKKLRVNSNFPTWVSECTARMPYTYKVVNARNMNIIYKEGTTFFNNGEILDADVLSDNKIDVIFIVFDMMGRMVYVSPPQNLCANETFSVYDKLPVNNSVVTNIDISGLCTSQGGINTLLVPNNVDLWYRNMSSPANTPFGGWAPLVRVVNGKGCARGLIAGQSYDFALPVANNDDKFQQTFSKCLKRPNGLKIPESGDLVINVKSPLYNVYQTFVLKLLQDGVYDANFQNYPLPANICTELNNRYSAFILKK